MALFSDKIYGQSALIAQLQLSIKNERIPHAQIFLGKNGYGNLAVALEYVASLVCTEGNGVACGECNACHKMKKFIHPDVHFSFPFTNSKNVASQYYKEWRTQLEESFYFSIHDWHQSIGGGTSPNIYVTECNDILKKLSLKSNESNYKILLMWLPEYLGLEGNRLLKLLEEPPEGTIFILVAENAEAILNTVLSRCQLVKTPPLFDEDIMNYLVSKGEDSLDLTTIVTMSQGDIIYANELIHDNFSNEAQAFINVLRCGYSLLGKECSPLIEEISKNNKESHKLMFQFGLTFMRDLLLFKLTNTLSRHKESIQETIKNFSKVVELAEIDSIITLLNDCLFAVDRNANIKILMMDTLIQLNTIIKKKKQYQSIQITA